jgi:hypothetical protein
MLLSPLRWLLLIGAFWTTSGFSFGLHYLVTDRALPKDDPTLDKPMATEPLREFLRAERVQLAGVFSDYYRSLKAHGEKRFAVIPFDVQKADVAAFLQASRLNPHTRILYLQRLLPGHLAPKPLVPFREVSLYETEEAGIAYLFKNAPGEKVTGREILDTYSDEPDWGMDNDLWSYPQYGYGKQPYGKPEGVTNQAPFHCLYSHESWILKLAIPEITQGMVGQRLELTTRLARFAFRSGHPYWGYRFTAWALHYLQDLAQPYHSRALPFADWRYYLEVLFSSHKDQMKADSTQLVINHHFLYEDFVKVLLQQSYVSANPQAWELAGALAEQEHSAEWKTQRPASLLEKVTAWSSSHAGGIDRALTQAFGSPWASDPHYDIEKDPDYRSIQVLSYTDAEKSRELTKLTAEDLRLAGQATRALLRYCRVPDAV